MHLFKQRSTLNCPLMPPTQMRSTVGIDSLPPGLLHRILEYVHGYEHGKVTGGHLCHSLVVCRTWQTQARLVLYKNVGFDLDKFGRFLEAFDHDAISHVTYKMTVRLPSREEALDMCGSQRTDACMDEWLRRLAQDVLPHMRRLARFSLIQAGQPSCFGVRKTAMAAVLEALPLSCVDLMLKVYLEGEEHLCGVLRDLLPRMHRVVLALNPICSSILGAYTDQGFCLAPLPKSLWLLIRCTMDGSQVQACPAPHRQGPISSKDSIVGAVRHAVHGSMEAAVTLIPGLGRLDYLAGRGA